MSNNKRHKRVLEFDVMDAPVIAHAFAIAASTAMMSGHKDAQARMQQYRKIVMQLIPPEANLFDEEQWCEIGIALAKATTFHVGIKPFRWQENNPWVKEGVIAVRIGDREWRHNSLGEGSALIEQVYKVLTDMAPVGCEGTFSTAIAGRAVLTK